MVQENIKKALKLACSLIKISFIKKKCNKIIDKKADYIIDLLIKNEVPRKICDAIGFCQSTVDNNEFTPDYCIYCKKLVQETEDKVGNNKTKVLQIICSDICIIFILANYLI